ncbi:hypothetical protein SAMN04487767_10682 [Bacillus wiedmannii]|uniref:DUF5348 domain-containing protein n=1 Tax=Bacillus wiedmannii TaxID=1890302 RepID=A0A1G6UST0_9BACI|nr:hypothetical protein CN560_17925 [Bacillus wiedmannii]PGC71904.1 hypothetical protein COM25_25550 [Bacillus wiedmannii]PHG13407.1 hypothetical protein COI74_29205 [Bacillus wiedmannii]SDD43766.1 hypothetical protein SAMN04487767_10682 [Bacillus wiedmannii]
MFTEEVEVLNQIGRVKEKGDWYYYGFRQHNADFTLRDFQIKKLGFTVYYEGSINGLLHLENETSYELIIV